MARTCTVCVHPEAHVINVELVSRTPYRDIAGRYGLSKSALKRHSEQHIPELLVKARDAVEVHEASDLVGELRRIADNLQRLSEKAELDEDYSTAIRGQVALLKRAELWAKVGKLIDERPVLNLYLSAEWLELRALLIRTLEPHREARDAVLRALESASNETP